MRYDDWDVILFPKGSHVPIQEFKVACYLSTDESGRQLPNVVGYIYSLPPPLPFRISVHSWAETTKPSALVSSRRKPNQKVVYAVRVYINGVELESEYFPLSTTWPKEISTETKKAGLSQQKPSLLFPPFQRQVLVQSSWDARGDSNRIKVLLSEQLISDPFDPSDFAEGSTNDIVCFTFQHAPQSVLEQAGISWPIRNPLYLSNMYGRGLGREPFFSQTSPSVPTASEQQNPGSDSRTHPSSRPPNTANATSQHSDSRGSHFPLPKISQFSGPSVATMRREYTFGPSGGALSGAGMNTTTAKNWTPSKPMGHSFTTHHSHMAPHRPQMPPSWSTLVPRGHAQTSFDDKTPPEMNGQVFDKNSPSKRHLDPPHNELVISTPVSRAAHPPHTNHAYFVPNMQFKAILNRQSSAAMAQTSEYVDVDRSEEVNTTPPENLCGTHLSDMWPKDKENKPPTHFRLPIPQFKSGIPTPATFESGRQSALTNMFVSGTPALFPSVSQFVRGDVHTLAQNTGSPHLHSYFATGTVKGRKEGFGGNGNANGNVRHDQSLLPDLDSGTLARPIEIIDLEAIDPGLASVQAPGMERLGKEDGSRVFDGTGVGGVHAGGVGAALASCEGNLLRTPATTQHAPKSSINSTGRLERQLFSALGDELAGFGAGVHVGAPFVEGLRGGLGDSDMREDIGEDTGTGDADAKRKRGYDEQDGISERRGKRCTLETSEDYSEQDDEEMEEEEDMLGLGRGYSG